MAWTYTTADLLSAIKRRAMMPSNQSTFLNSDLLDLADDELHLGLLPLIMSAREEYYVTAKNLVAGSLSYDIPTRAIGMKLRDVVLVDGSGRERNLPQIDPFDGEYFNSTESHPAFFFRNNKLMFTSAPIDTPRAYYFIRPGKLVETTDAARITAIDPITGIVDVSLAPTDFAVGSVIDFIKATPGYETLGMDVTIAGLAGTSVTFAVADLPAGLAIGDYVAMAGESPVIQVPREFQSILAQRVAVKVLEAIGDQSQMQMSQDKLDRMEAAAFGLIEPRVDGANKKIINRQSGLRGQSRFNR